jgi:hypothetical protein
VLAEIQASRIRSITDGIGILAGADPTGVVNAAAVIQAHLDTGDPVFIPDGSFLLGATALTLSHSNQVLFGVDMLASVLVYSGSGAAIIFSPTAGWRTSRSTRAPPGRGIARSSWRACSA